jgi:hypothetical protein
MTCGSVQMVEYVGESLSSGAVVQAAVRETFPDVMAVRLGVASTSSLFHPTPPHPHPQPPALSIPHLSLISPSPPPPGPLSRTHTRTARTPLRVNPNVTHKPPAHLHSCYDHFVGNCGVRPRSAPAHR